jgi:hypothetical protein
MSIEFDEDNMKHFQSRKIFGEMATPKIIKILLKTGIVKNEKTAGVLLLIFSILALISSFLIAVALLKQPEVRYELSPEVIETLPDDVKAKIYEANKK